MSAVRERPAHTEILPNRAWLQRIRSSISHRLQDVSGLLQVDKDRYYHTDRVDIFDESQRQQIENAREHLDKAWTLLDNVLNPTRGLDE